MAVDLSNFTQSFLYEINAVGQTNLTPTSDEIVGRLIDAFYECKLSGFLIFQGYTCDDIGLITPYKTTPPPQYPDQSNPYNFNGLGDLPREYVQLIVLFGGYRALITTLQNVNTQTTARAGAVETSVQKSGAMYIAALKAVTAKIDIALTRLSDLGSTSVTVLDAVIDSTSAIENDATWFVRGAGSYGSDEWSGY